MIRVATADEAALIPDAIEAIDQWLTPGDPGRITAHITRLLAVFYVPALDPALQIAVLEDWVSDLAEFPAYVVADACERWRRGQSRRPVPADIRGICLDLVRDPENQRHVLRVAADKRRTAALVALPRPEAADVVAR